MLKHIPGFSLIELMVVISLMCIACLLVVPNVSFLTATVMRTEVEKLYATCMYAQRCAIVSNKVQTITFDSTKSCYILGNVCHTLPKGVKFGFFSGAQGPPSSPSHFITSPITFKEQRIVFNPTGIIQAGTIYIIDEKNRYMYALSSGITQVSFLRKYRYDKRWDLIV